MLFRYHAYLKEKKYDSLSLVYGNYYTLVSCSFMCIIPGLGRNCNFYAFIKFNLKAMNQESIHCHPSQERTVRPDRHKLNWWNFFCTIFYDLNCQVWWASKSNTIPSIQVPDAFQTFSINLSVSLSLIHSKIHFESWGGGQSGDRQT